MRALGRGLHHDEIERQLRATTGIHELAALSLLDNRSLASDVYKTLNSRFGPWAANAFRSAKESGHVGATSAGAVEGLVSDTRRLLRELENA